jgi:membrane protease YdiL (CAAX protease family)
MASPRKYAVPGGVILTILLLLFLVLGLDLPILRPIAKEHPDITYCIERSFYWLLVAVLWVYAAQAEKQPLLIWEEKRYSVGTLISHIAALFFILMIILSFVNFFITPITHEQPSKVMHRMVDFLRNKKYLIVYTALTAGVTEELVIRGYLMPRLDLLFKDRLKLPAAASAYLAIFISSLLFGIAHFGYGTVKNVVDPFVIGLVLAIYYWKYRNINVAIIFHFLWDLGGLFLLTKLR